MAAQPPEAPPEARRARILAELLARHGAALRRQARRNSSSKADAEDALHDGYVQFLRHFDGEPEGALRWLSLTVKRCAWKIGNRERRRGSRSSVITVDLEPKAGETQFVVVDQRDGPAELIERVERLAARIELLDHLKPDERTALLLCAAGYSYREIAERQGWTQTKVNRCIYEGRVALRAVLAREGAKSRG